MNRPVLLCLILFHCKRAEEKGWKRRRKKGNIFVVFYYYYFKKNLFDLLDFTKFSKYYQNICNVSHSFLHHIIDFFIGTSHNVYIYIYTSDRWYLSYCMCFHASNAPYVSINLQKKNNKSSLSNDSSKKMLYLFFI